MTWFVISAAALCLVTVALLTRSLWWRVGAADTSVKSSPMQAIALAVFVSIVTVAGYTHLGSPTKLALGPESSAAAAAAGQQYTPEQIASMVDRLAERMKAEPDNVDGWLLLGRSRLGLAQYPQAVEAYRMAAKLRANDADVMLDLADAVAMANNRTLDGEPIQLIQQALKIAPANPRALALAGTAAFINKDYKGAVGYWEQLVKVEPAGSEMAQRVQSSIDQARQLGGMSLSVAASGGAAKTAAASGTDKSAGPAQVSGTVRLSPALKDKASPDDTVFVFARPAEGSRMPLAILRKQVKDLPIQFTLDDSMAMSPAAKLSDHKQVTVGARISKRGQAMPQPGDLQGTTAAAVGATGLKIEIGEVVGQ
jgi:cytochrome c-type biogenesis protein CcmH